MAGADITTERLAIIALAALALIILLVVLVQNMTAGASKAQEEKCRSSIQLHSQFVKTSGERGAPSIACTANNVTIDNSDDAKAKRQIADQLVFCWDRWQHGDVELFKDEGTYCNPCSVLTFTEPGKKLGGLSDYLRTENKPGGGTYEEYLFPKTTADYTLPTNKDTSYLPLDTSKQYAVVFYYDKYHSMKTYLEMLDRDPAAAVRVVEDAVPGTGVMAGVGALGGVLAVCTVVSGGVCAVIAAPVATVGAVVFGGITLAVKTHQEIPYPEWYAYVVLVPNDGTGYRALGCSGVFQEGPPSIVNGAENLQ